MISNIEEYLFQLKKELKGLDKAVIQDALADAEEHLTTAIANLIEQNDKLSKEEVLMTVIDKYGEPSEIATEYGKMEKFYTPVFAPMQNNDPRPWWQKVLLIVGDLRAWGAVLFMLIAMITGIIYFTWVTTGLSFSFSLIILIIGLPVLGLFLLSIRGLALVEGRIVEALLGTRMPRKPMFLAKDKGWWGKFKALFTQGVTWKAMAYMILQMPLGIIYFTLIVTLLATSIGCIAAPVLELVFHLPLEINGEEAFTPRFWLFLLPVAGVLLLLGMLHLAKLIGRIHGKFAKIMLVRD